MPAAPLRRPRDAAASVLGTVSDLLRGAAEVMSEGDVDHGRELLAEARATDWLVRRLQHAADEGMAVVSSSPFRVRHRPGIRRMAELVEPLDRSLRSTRVLVRQVAAAAYHRRPVPTAYIGLTRDLADAVDLVVAELKQDRLAEVGPPRPDRHRRGDRPGPARGGDDGRGGAGAAAVGGGRRPHDHGPRPAAGGRQPPADTALAHLDVSRTDRDRCRTVTVTTPDRTRTLSRFSAFSASHLEVSTARAGDVALVSAVGEIDLSNAGLLRDALQTAVAMGLPTTAVDLSGIEFIDSVGLGVLTGARKRLRARGASLTVWRPSRVVARGLAMTGLDHAFVVDTRSDLDPADLGRAAAVVAVDAAPEASASA